MKSPTSFGKLKKRSARLGEHIALSIHKKTGFMLRRISGDSMFPSYENGQAVLLRAARPISVGDVIMFVHDGLEKIKRVSEVDADKLYVLGDNPRFSTDSRHFGLIHKTTVLGTVVWPKEK